MPTYPNNFLTDVICRVDIQPILILRSEEPADFQESVRQDYPRIEREQEIEISLQSDGGAPERIKPPVSWKFQNKGRDASIVLSSNHFAFEAKTYTDFPDFLAKFTAVYGSFVKIHKPSIVTRVGLRYVNQIFFPSGDPFDWSGLLSESLTATLGAFPSNRDQIARCMHQLILNKGSHRIGFQFGVFNSEFPNTIARKEFVLDFDCVSQEERDPHDVLELLGMFNAEISDLFEQSIAEGLRQIMRENSGAV